MWSRRSNSRRTMRPYLIAVSTLPIFFLLAYDSPSTPQLLKVLLYACNRICHKYWQDKLYPFLEPLVSMISLIYDAAPNVAGLILYMLFALIRPAFAVHALHISKPPKSEILLIPCFLSLLWGDIGVGNCGNDWKI